MMQNIFFGVVYLLISYILVESQTQQKLATKFTHITIQFHSKKLNTSNLNSFSIIKNILLQHCQKSYSLYRFSRKLVSSWCQIKHLHCTIPMHPKTSFSKHLHSKYLYVPVNHGKIKLFQRHRNFLFAEWGLNAFLKVARCFYPIKCFKYFN